MSITQEHCMMILEAIKNLTISDVQSLFVIGGSIFAFYQWRKSSSLKKAEFVNNFIKKIRDEKDIIEILRYLDLNDHWYSLDFHDNENENKQKFEQHLDKTLSYFSYICYLKKKKIISCKEFNFFNYHIKLILKNPGVQDYFYHLYHYVTTKFKAKFQYQYLLEYGIEMQIVGKDIYDMKAHLLNDKYSAHFDSWYAQ
jgi:hypothetical protein